MLQFCQEARQGWWQKLHCPGDLVTNTSSSDNSFLQLQGAVQLLLYVLQQQGLLFTIKPHAAAAMQVVLSAAAAALAVKKEALHLVTDCLDAAVKLANLLPLEGSNDSKTGQKQQQQQGLGGAASCSQGVSAAAASSQQQCSATGIGTRQLLGLLLHLLRQLLQLSSPPPIARAGSISSSSSNGGGKQHSRSSSSGGNHSSRGGTSAGSSGSRSDSAAVLDPLTSEGREQDVPLHALTTGMLLLNKLLGPLLDPQLLAASLQQQQQQQQQVLDQVSWALQIAEAAARVVTAAAVAPMRKTFPVQFTGYRASCQVPEPRESFLDTPEFHLGMRLAALSNTLVSLVRIVSRKLAQLLKVPGAWEGLRGSAQGQQLLQAALSLLMVRKEAVFMHLENAKISLHLPLMQLITRDIKAYLAAREGECAAAAADAAEGSAAAAACSQQQQLLLPHPQLVTCVLALAAQRYKWLCMKLLQCEVVGDARSGARPETHFKRAELLAAYFAPKPPQVAAAVELAVDDYLSDSYVLFELLDTLGELHASIPHHQQQQGQRQRQEQGQQGPQARWQQQQQQQQLPAAWEVLLHGSSLHVLLLALFQAEAELAQAVADAAPFLSKWQQEGKEDAAKLQEQAAAIQRLSNEIEAVAQQENSTRKGHTRAQAQKETDQMTRRLQRLCQQHNNMLPKLLPAPMPLLTAIARSLHIFGQLLYSLPSRQRCNNHDCLNLSTVSEGAALVRGRACVCGGCMAGMATSAAAADDVPAARWVVTKFGNVVLVGEGQGGAFRGHAVSYRREQLELGYGQSSSCICVPACVGCKHSLRCTPVPALKCTSPSAGMMQSCCRHAAITSLRPCHSVVSSFLPVPRTWICCMYMHMCGSACCH
jgi:hypothetical protein